MRLSKGIISAASAVLLVLGCSAAVSAQEKEAGSGPSPYRDCGIGAALFPDTHWAAVTSNVIWDIGTTAVTSATMSPETCSGAAVQAARFINDTYDSVVEETAKGEGDHLIALLEIYGCDSSVHSDIVDAIRPEVGAAVIDESYTSMTHLQKAEQYFQLVDTQVRTAYAQNCAA